MAPIEKTKDGYDYDFVVIGGGSGGLASAKEGTKHPFTRNMIRVVHHARRNSRNGRIYPWLQHLVFMQHIKPS